MGGRIRVMAMAAALVGFGCGSITPLDATNDAATAQPAAPDATAVAAPPAGHGPGNGDDPGGGKGKPGGKGPGDDDGK
ncbi:MAG TPA: hypothetical protein VKZ18_01635 [Polyangia bacterium]|nr:hypothetical protein [Polyangia bacterium]